MIRIREGEQESEVSYEEFIRAIQEGRVTSETYVLNDVLTAGIWKRAADLKLFQAWSPGGKMEQRPDPESAETPPAPPEVDEPATEEEPPREHEEPAWDPIEEPEDEPSEESPPPDSERESNRHRAESEEDPSTDPIPWEMISRIGPGPALYGTAWFAFRNIEEFFRRIARTNPLLPALLFGLLFTGIAVIIHSVYDVMYLKLFSGPIESMRIEMPELKLPDPDQGIGGALSTNVTALLFYPIFTFASSWLTHLLLRSFGQPRRDFATTFRVISYASVANVLVLIPFCGYIAALVWNVYLIVRGLSQLHGVSPFLSLSVIVLPGLVLGCLAVFATYSLGFGG